MRAIPHFADRYDAGRRLGLALRHHRLARPLVVLALPRGGVPVAALVAHELDAPLDLFVVRRIGAPLHDDVTLGAITSGEALLLDDAAVAAAGIGPDRLDRLVAAERQQLERREVAWRGVQPLPPLADATVVLVDDGADTGAAMRVAIRALRQLGPRAIIAAVPTSSREALEKLREEADECVCLIAPEPFAGIGAWYRDFTPPSDNAIRMLLADARRREELEHEALPLHEDAPVRAEAMPTRPGTAVDRTLVTVSPMDLAPAPFAPTRACIRNAFSDAG